MSLYRRGNTGALLISIGGLLLLCYCYYSMSDLTETVDRKERELRKQIRNGKTLREQLKVVYQHTSKLEDALKNERENHKETKQELMVKVEMFTLNLTKTKHEAMNRFNALDTDYKMAKANHEEMKQNYLALQQTYSRLSSEHTRLSAEYKEDYRKLKDSKESESISLQSRVQDLYNQRVQYQELAKRFEENYKSTVDRLEQVTELARQYQDRVKLYAKEVRNVKNELTVCRFGSSNNYTRTGDKKNTPDQLDRDDAKLDELENISKNLTSSKNDRALEDTRDVNSLPKGNGLKPSNSEAMSTVASVPADDAIVKRIFAGVTEKKPQGLDNSVNERNRDEVLESNANQFINKQRQLFKDGLPGARKSGHQDSDDEKTVEEETSKLTEDDVIRKKYGNNRYVVNEIIRGKDEEPTIKENSRYRQLASDDKDKLSPLAQAQQGETQDQQSLYQSTVQPIAQKDGHFEEENQKIREDRNIRPIKKIGGSIDGEQKIKFNSDTDYTLKDLEEPKNVQAVEAKARVNQLKPPSKDIANEENKAKPIAQMMIAPKQQMPIPNKRMPGLFKKFLRPRIMKSKDDFVNKKAGVYDRKDISNENAENKHSQMNEPMVDKQNKFEANDNKDERMDVKGVTLEDDENGDQNLDHQAGQQNVQGGDDDSDERDVEQEET